MKDDINILLKQFYLVAKKGWIESINNSLGSIGLTFEKQLDKKPDCLFFPDYYGIEIKCLGRFSRYPISLFTCAFDGPRLHEINYIVEKYGRYDKVYTNKKVLYTQLSFNNKCVVDGGYQFKLDLDKSEEKIYLCVYDLDNNLIERESFVYLLSIYNHLMLKLKHLALVRASKKVIDNKKHFRYYEIKIYELISFEKFVELLRSDDIIVSLISRIGKSGNDAGRYRNKNLVFQIKKDKLDKLFNLLHSYNYDLDNFMLF